MSLEVVIGPMFSGKSSFIDSAVRRRRSIGANVLVVKPGADIRYSAASEVVTHDGVRVACYTTNAGLMDIPHDITRTVQTIIIDEAQFFDDLVLFATCEVENFNRDVIVVGLDGDFNRKPFGQVLDCIPLADRVTRLTALCSCCRDGTPALFSHRKIDQGGQVLVGGAEAYEPLCRRCFTGKCKL
jgi:thymidine kinase